MTSGDALYEAVLAAPADDLPRLVYADWLEEHGDAERAEFIRLQIELARLPDKDPRRSAMEVKANFLRRSNYSRWAISELRGAQTFARGFVDEVWASAEDVVHHVDSFARQPLRSLRITAAADWIDRLAGLPVLGRISTLDLSNNIGIQGRFDRLFSNGGLRNLTSLILRNVRVWGEDLPRWPTIPGFPQLTHLDLSGNPVGDEGLGILAVDPGFASLQFLILYGHGQEAYDLLGSPGIQQLAASPRLGRLTELHLSGQTIGDDGLAALAWSAHTGSLIRLGLSENRITDAGFEALASSSGFATLKWLDLSEASISTTGALALVRWPRLSTIDSVHVQASLTAEDAGQVLRSSPWAKKIEWEPFAPE